MTVISNEKPAYRILAVHGFYGPDDHLHELDSKIYFDGEPNEEMEPLNESARVRLQTFLNKLDNLAREAAVKLGKAFIERPKTLDGALEMASSIQRDTMAIMGAKKDVVGIEKIDTLDDVDNIPEVGNSVRRGRGRPKKIASVG